MEDITTDVLLNNHENIKKLQRDKEIEDYFTLTIVKKKGVLSTSSSSGFKHYYEIQGVLMQFMTEFNLKALDRKAKINEDKKLNLGD